MDYCFSVIPWASQSIYTEKDEVPVEYEVGSPNAPRALPVCFQDNAACAAVLRLAGQAHISVRVVCNASSSSPMPLYLRVYTHRSGLVNQVRDWGAPQSAQLWAGVLGQSERGPIVERVQPALSVTSDAFDLSLHMQRIEAVPIDGNGAISLAPELGDMHFGSFEEVATTMHAPARSVVPRKCGGLLRAPLLDPPAMNCIASALVQCQPRQSVVHVGLSRQRTRCSLMLAPDELVSRMAPQGGVLLIRTLSEARATSLRALEENRLVVLSFGVELLAELRAWEDSAITTFAQAWARTGGVDAALPLSFSSEDKARFFAARCPGQNWVVPFPLLQWNRLIVVLKSIEAGDAQRCRFFADATWAVLQDPSATLRQPNWYSALCAATVLGLPEPSAHHPHMFAAAAGASVSLQPELAVSPRFSCVSVHASEHEIAVRQALQSDGAPETDFRLCLGMHPSILSYEKMVAAVHGMPVARLKSLLQTFAVNSSTEYAKDTLQRLERGEGGDCCVCMSEPGTILTFCGHVYCADCVHELWNGVPRESTVKCCVCRTQNFRDDWWLTIPKGEFLGTALLSALLQLGKELPKPLLVALPSLSDATVLMGRLSFSGATAVVVSSLDEEGARAAMVAALARTDVQFVLCPITDISPVALTMAGVQTLVLLGTHLPCQVTEFSGGGRAYAYKPWLHAVVELVYGWAPPLADGRVPYPSGLNVQVTALCADPLQKGESLIEQLQQQFARAEEEPARAPRKYDLRSGRRNGRACIGSAL